MKLKHIKRIMKYRPSDIPEKLLCQWKKIENESSYIIQFLKLLKNAIFIEKNRANLINIYKVEINITGFKSFF